MQQALPPSPFDSFDNFSHPTTVEELLITHEDGPQFVHKLGQSIVSIGRDNSNDIVLNANKVSRNHARLEWHRGLWHVVDLGSTNGTILGETLLAPSSTNIWPLNQTLQVGAFSIELRRSLHDGQNDDRTEFFMPNELDADVQALRASFEASRPIRYTANLWPTNIRNTGQVCVAVTNGASSADTFQLKMSGDKELRFSVTEWQSNIPAGLERRQNITIAPHRRPFVGVSKNYRFRAELTATEGGKRKLEGKLKVDPIMTVRTFFLLLTIVSLFGAAAYYAFLNFM